MKVSPNRYLGSPGRPSWSADGKRVAVSLNREAVIVDRESEAVTSRVGPEGANVGAPQYCLSDLFNQFLKKVASLREAARIVDPKGAKVEQS